MNNSLIKTVAQWDILNPQDPNSAIDGATSAGLLGGDPNAFINNAFTWVIGISTLVAVVMLVVAGFEYVTAGGEDDKVKKAKTRIQNALIGLAVIFLAALIVNAVFKVLTGLAA